MKNQFLENVYSCHVPDRLLDASLLKFDLPKVIEKIINEDAWKTGDRNAITLVKNEYMRIVLIALHKKSEINFHQSGNLISIQLIQGELNFKTDSQSVILKEGGLLAVHEDMKHNLIALEESVFLLTIIIAL